MQTKILLWFDVEDYATIESDDAFAELLDMLDEVRTQYDLSILLSTHDFATLEEYADKVILLQSTVLKAGRPGEVLGSPEFQQVFHLTLGRGRS